VTAPVQLWGMTVIEPGAVARFGLTRRRLAMCSCGVVIAGSLAVLAWSQRPDASPSPPAASPASVIGVVQIEGGPSFIDGSGSVSRSHPLRNAKVIVTGITAGGDALHRQFRADAFGRFKLSLPPGQYTVAAIAYGTPRPLSSQPHAKVTVTPGRPVRIRLIGHMI
jgi:hypothetical protein